MKIGYIQENPRKKEKPFRSGDRVISNDLGNGIVVGFSSISSEPHVFFYEEQRVVCVGSESLKKL